MNDKGLPIVVSYFEELHRSKDPQKNIEKIQESRDLIQMWKESWSRNGWQAIVLGPDDAKAHPDFSAVNLQDHTSNLFKYALLDHVYLQACYSRWFAYANYASTVAQNIVWADFDVINYSLSPDMLPKLKDENDIIPFSGAFACGYSGFKGLNVTIDALKNVHHNDELAKSLAMKFSELSKLHGRRVVPLSQGEPAASSYYSDMTLLGHLVFDKMKHSQIFRDWRRKIVDVRVERALEWKLSPLVHFHHGIYGLVDGETLSKHNKNRVALIQLLRNPKGNRVNINRDEIINFVIKEISAKSYLEIGVQSGKNFEKVKCETKSGVEPFPREFQPTHVMTSEAFFKAFPEARFDVIFIDGDHRKDAVKNDILSALQHLNTRGAIICHDLNPVKEVYQLDMNSNEFKENRATTGSGLWTGDGWKAWVELRSELDNVYMRVVDADFGCGVITRGAQTKIRIPETLTYNFLESNRKEALNLISVEEFLKEFS